MILSENETRQNLLRFKHIFYSICLCKNNLKWFLSLQNNKEIDLLNTRNFNKKTTTDGYIKIERKIIFRNKHLNFLLRSYGLHVGNSRTRNF